MGMFKPTEWADLNPISNVPESRDKDMRPSNGDLLVILLIDIGGIGSAPEKLFRSVARWLVMEPRGRGAFGIMVHAALPLLVPSSHHRFQAARFWLRAESR